MAKKQKFTVAPVLDEQDTSARPVRFRIRKPKLRINYDAFFGIPKHLLKAQERKKKN